MYGEFFSRPEKCKRKACLTGRLHLYTLKTSQSAVEAASGVRAGEAELLGAEVTGECVNRKRGLYAVSLRTFYRVGALTVMSSGLRVPISGLAVFRGRLVLAGNPNVHGGTAADVYLDTPEIEDAGFEDRAVPEFGTEVENLPPRLFDFFGNDLYFGREGRSVQIAIKQPLRVRLEPEHKSARRTKKVITMVPIIP